VLAVGRSDHLTLRQLSLKQGGEWAKPATGLRFVFPIAGSSAYVSGTISQPIGRGDVLVVNEPFQGKVCATAGHEVIFREFSLCLEHLFPLLAASEISLVQPLAKQFNTFKIFAATSPRAIECHRLIAQVPVELNLDHRGQLLRVAATILNDEFQALRQSRGSVNQVEKNVGDMVEKLTADQLRDLSVGELAAKFNCSRRQLNRVFHQYFNMSVASLKMEMRLLKATSLLRDVNIKVIDVAAECGFNHLGLFNACFRKRFGTTPSEWRQVGQLKAPRVPGAASNRRRLPLLRTRESRLYNSAATGRAHPAHCQLRVQNVVESTSLPDQEKPVAPTDSPKPPNVAAGSMLGGKNISISVSSTPSAC
jgi:AraC-like DNA-binding protein